MPKWTEEQQQVIDLRNKTMLVSAGAGSGKTAVLVERIIQRIQEEQNPVNIDSLLVVTFTNAAAAEMKERIGIAIQKALEENPSSEHLYRQSLLLQKAQITTLHSFCLDLVRQNFFRLGIEPGMKIADDTENQLLLAETLDEILETHYSNPDGLAVFIQLVDRYGGREDEVLRSVIINLYQMAQSMAQPAVWLRQIATETEIDWILCAKKEVLVQLERAKTQMQKAIQISTTDDGLRAYTDHMESEYNWICELSESFQNRSASDGWDVCAKRLSTDGFQRLPSVKKNACDGTIKEAVTQYRNQAKKRIAKVQEEYFCRSKETFLQEIAEQLPIKQQIVALTLELMEAFQQKKSKKGIMDFHDMEHFCYQLLYTAQEDGTMAYSELALELKNQYTEILVDEYQDINDLQEAILSALSRENNRFMVGDIKQSIYGFRMANPGLFADKYNAFPHACAETIADVEQTAVRIDLNRNFRCRNTIVDGVNEVFSQIMTGRDGDLYYDTHAQLIYGADYPPVPQGVASSPEQVHLMVLYQPEETEEEHDVSDDGIGESAEQPMSTMEAEGLQICKEIQALMQSGASVFDKKIGDYRKITWRDIVILLRAPKSAGSVYSRILKEQGIPSAVDAGDGYFTAWEIRIITDLLHIIDNPLQDIPLLAVLKAPFFGFNEEELAQMRMISRNEYFYHCITMAADAEGAYTQTISDSLRTKASSFLQTLSRWRDLSVQLDVSNLIWQLYKDTGFYEYVGTLQDGIQRQANLRALHERAKSYEDTSFHGVFMFLRFLEMLDENNADLEPAKVLGENDNVVRIMSIHKSKGLEFPVVFLGGLGRKFNSRDTQQDFLLDKEYGIAFSAVDDALEIRYKTLAQRVISCKKRSELLQEEKRVLYVAMTRARERLYLIGSCKNPESRKSVSPEEATCYLDWFLPLSLDAPLWNVSYVALQSCNTLLEEEATIEDVAISIEQDTRLYEQIDVQLSWDYQNKSFTSVKAQASVTELKQQFQMHSELPKPVFHFDSRPEAVKENQGLSSAEKGTLLHLLFRHVDLSVEITEAYIADLVQELEAKEFIAQNVSQEIAYNDVLAFFQSSLGRRLIAADENNRYRELPFVVALDSHFLDASLPKGEKSILVQGIIDCLWKEEDGWILVDYKSDRLTAQQTNQLIARYGGQLAIYRYAVEQILKEPVKEAYFYHTATAGIVDATDATKADSILSKE